MCRRIEVVITGLTRNIVGSVTHHSLKLRCLSAFTPRAFALSEFCISQFSRNLGIRLCLYNFIWRRIEVVITGLTRNQLGSNPPRVRISPSPPRTTVILGLRLFSLCDIIIQQYSLEGHNGIY